MSEGAPYLPIRVSTLPPQLLIHLCCFSDERTEHLELFGERTKIGVYVYIFGERTVRQNWALIEPVRRRLSSSLHCVAVEVWLWTNMGFSSFSLLFSSGEISASPASTFHTFIWRQSEMNLNVILLLVVLILILKGTWWDCFFVCPLVTCIHFLLYPSLIGRCIGRIRLMWTMLYRSCCSMQISQSSPCF